MAFSRLTRPGEFEERLPAIRSLANVDAETLADVPSRVRELVLRGERRR